MLEAVTLLPPGVRRAMSEVQSGGYPLEIRTEAGSSYWPPWLRVAHVLPLRVGERNIGTLAVGTVDHDALTLDEQWSARNRHTRGDRLGQRAALQHARPRDGARKSAEESFRKRTAARTSFSPCCRMSCATRSRRSCTSRTGPREVAPTDPRIAWVREVIERQVTHLAGSSTICSMSRASPKARSLCTARPSSWVRSSSTASRSSGRSSIRNATLSVDVPERRSGYSAISRAWPDLQQRAAQCSEVHG